MHFEWESQTVYICVLSLGPGTKHIVNNSIPNFHRKKSNLYFYKISLQLNQDEVGTHFSNQCKVRYAKLSWGYLGYLQKRQLRPAFVLAGPLSIATNKNHQARTNRLINTGNRGEEVQEIWQMTKFLFLRRKKKSRERERERRD